MSFESDIQGQNTQLLPIIVIEKGGIGTASNYTPDYIFLSTNNSNINILHDSIVDLYPNTTRHCKPLLLNIPSIKESIDIDSRKFKISNVSLDISNIEYEGKRFTDILSETSLINIPVSIYFKSPSTTWVTSTDVSDDYLDTLCPLVYQGIIRRITHDDTKVKIELEDLTEQKAHKDLPQETLGDGDDVPDKFKNSIIPFVYGNVDRCPSIYTFSTDYTDSEGVDYNLIFGDTISFPYIDEVVVDNTSDSQVKIDTGLYIRENDKYLQVVQNDNLSNKYSKEDSIEINGINYDSIKLYKLFSDQTYNRNAFSIGAVVVVDEIPLLDGIAVSGVQQYTTVSETTDVTADFNLASILILPVQIITNIISGIAESDQVGGVYLDDGTEVYPEPTTGDISAHPQTFTFEDLSVYKSSESYTYTDSFNVQHTETGSIRKFNMLWSLQDVSHDAVGGVEPQSESKYLFYIKGGIDISNVSGASNLSGLSTPTYKLDVRISDDLGEIDSENLIYSQSDESVSGNNFIGSSDSPPQHISIYIYSHPTFDGITFYGNNGIDFDLGVNDLRLQTLFYLSVLKGDEVSTDFYANVNGRINTFDDHPGDMEITEGYWVFETIFEGTDFEMEVPGYFVPDAYPMIDNPIDIIYDLVRSELGHDAIDEAEYAEAKAAHDGWKFGFTVNKKINSKKLIEDIAKSTKCFPKFKNDGTFGFNTIKDNYTVSGDYNTATEIKESEVISYSFKKTKPEQIYKNVTVSYNKDYAQDSYLKTTEEGDYDLGDDPYYGIEDSSDAHLEFESDYIRHDNTVGAEQTADKLASFLSEQYRNDHLLFNLKLPLQYINLEIGDLVRFEDLFNGVTAYGIDYRLIQDIGVIDPSNGIKQRAFPLFMITSTKKNLDSVQIECMQLHHLKTVLNFVEEAWYDGTGDGDTAGLFYFPDADPIVISDVDVTPFVITPPEIWSMTENIPLDASEGAMNTIWAWNEDGTSVDIKLPPAIALDGTQATFPDNNLSSLVQINVLGETYANPSWEGNPQVWIGPFSMDTQVVIIYSVTSPTSGLTTTIPILISIDVNNPPILDIFIKDTAPPENFEPHEGATWEFTHILQLEDVEGVNYAEKYVYNTSPDQQIQYSASDLDDPDGDLTNSVVFGWLGNFNSLLEGNAPDIDLYADAQWAFNTFGVDEWASDIIALVQDSTGLYTWKKWSVLIQGIDPILLGDTNLDGIIDILDIVNLGYHIMGVDSYGNDSTLEGEALANADFNADGAVDVADVVSLMHYILGI